MRAVKFSIGLSLCLFFLFSLYVGTGGAQLPSLPHTIKGSVYIDGIPASIGTEVTAKLGNETVSEFNITNEGLYAIGIGVTPENQGETVRLYVNGIETEVEVVLKSGEVETIDLSVKTPLGNNIWYYAVAVLIVILVLIVAMVKYRRRQ